jgi:hypothetical protein
MYCANNVKENGVSEKRQPRSDQSGKSSCVNHNLSASNKQIHGTSVNTEIIVGTSVKVKVILLKMGTL